MIVSVNVHHAASYVLTVNNLLWDWGNEGILLPKTSFHCDNTSVGGVQVVQCTCVIEANGTYCESCTYNSIGL